MSVDDVHHFVGSLTGAFPGWDTANPAHVGPVTTLGDALPFVVATIAVGVFHKTCDRIGYAFAKALGLKEAKCNRFGESFSELVYYSMSICMHLRLTYDCEWLWPSGWPAVMHDGRVQLDAALGPYQIPAAVKVYYIMEACWYSSGFCLLLLYKKKKDFAEMCAHHIITFSMLFLSYSTGYIRIGLVVIILHNAFDPFLHLAKCTHYIDLPVVPDVSFACCALSFSITRLYFYPQAIWYAWAGVCADTATCPGGLMDKTPVEFTLIGLLWALVPIHVMWFFMIIKVLKKALTNGKAQGDVRSDSEDDEDEPKKPKGKKVD